MLHRLLGWLVSSAVRIFYRFQQGGGEIPSQGPVLIVVNHPNMAADPALVLTVSQRWVSFIAKATLFRNPLLGWLLRALVVIPVHRRQEYENQGAEANLEAFDAVARTLARGSAVAIFPEGISHDEPSLAPLRTGAARMILRCLREGVTPALIPVGLTYADKSAFRSRALALVGEAIDYGSAPSESDEAGWVRHLTEEVSGRLERLTINLESWADLPLVEMAERIHASVFDRGRKPGQKVERTSFAARLLRRLRESDDAGAETLLERLATFDRNMAALDLEPASLERRTEAGLAIRWVAVHAVPIAICALGVGVALIVFFPPWVLTSALARSASRISRATVKILAGAILYPIWIGLAAAWLAIRYALPLGGFSWALALVGVALAAVAAAGWLGREARAVRRYLILRRSGDLSKQLLDERNDLAERFDRLRGERGRVV